MYSFVANMDIYHGFIIVIQVRGDVSYNVHYILINANGPRWLYGQL